MWRAAIQPCMMALEAARAAQSSNHIWLFGTPRQICLSVQFSRSVMSNSLRPHGLQHARLPCPSNFWSLLKLMSIKLVIPSNHFILCHPFLLPPSIFPSIRVFSNELVLRIKWPKYWSFSFSIRPSNEYSGLISYRMDWLDLLAAQVTLKNFLQHHSSKASILWRSAFTLQICIWNNWIVLMCN